MGQFDNFATLFGKGISADRAYVDQMRRVLEAEFNQAIDAKFSALNINEPNSTPITDPAVLARLSAVEQALQGVGDKLGGLDKFEAGVGTDEDGIRTRLDAIEKALIDTQGVLADAADHTADIPATPPPSSAPADGTPVATPPADASGGMAPATPANPPVPGDPVQGGSDAASPSAATPAFAPVTPDGTAAVTVPPAEIAPGTGQFVDPHATNPAAVATGAPTPVSGSASQPGGDTTPVLPDGAPNASEAGRSAPQPTAANVASPSAFDPIAARANPAPFANTEQDAPKAPVINAKPGIPGTGSDAAPVSANTATPGTVGQAGPDGPVSAQ